MTSINRSAYPARYNHDEILTMECTDDNVTCNLEHAVSVGDKTPVTYTNITQVTQIQHQSIKPLYPLKCRLVESLHSTCFLNVSSFGFIFCDLILTFRGIAILCGVHVKISVSHPRHLPVLYTVVNTQVFTDVVLANPRYIIQLNHTYGCAAE